MARRPVVRSPDASAQEAMIEVEPFLLGLDRNGHAVVPVDPALREQAVVSATHLGWITPNQQAGLFGTHPTAIGIGMRW